MNHLTWFLDIAVYSFSHEIQTGIQGSSLHDEYCPRFVFLPWTRYFTFTLTLFSLVNSLKNYEQVHVCRETHSFSVLDFVTISLHQLQNTKAKQHPDSTVPLEMFHSEQEAVRACELAGEHCQAISKLNQETAFIYTLESNLNLITGANSTLYVKAKFVTNLGKYIYRGTGNDKNFFFISGQWSTISGILCIWHSYIQHLSPPLSKMTTCLQATECSDLHVEYCS